jgi:outer membrane protein assembly factor BamB
MNVGDHCCKLPAKYAMETRNVLQMNKWIWSVQSLGYRRIRAYLQSLHEREENCTHPCRHPRGTGRRAFSIWLGLSLPFYCLGAEWPQYRGANHDGISRDRINTQWTGSVTNPVWRVLLTNCLGSFAVSGGRAFTQARRSISGLSKEVCVALSITDGAELWATPVDEAYYPNGGVGTDDGPRTTPSVEGGSVYVLTSYLKLYRLNATNGAVIWGRDLPYLYGGTVIDWQNAASPLLEDGRIFVNANCGSSTLMALRTSDGGLIWRTQDEAMTHSTPVLATIHGVRQVLFATQRGLVSLAPESGSLLWSFDYPFYYSTSLSVSPVVYENMVFHCASHGYDMGSFAIQVDYANQAWATTQLWSTNNPSSHWMTPICHEGFLYGMFGIQTYDSANAQLKCIDMRTGVVQWSTNGFGRGGTLLVDGRLLVLTERGQLVLAQPNPSAYPELARCLAIPNYHGTTNKCWNTPAVSEGRVFVRSTAYAACFDFSVPDLKLDPPQPVAANKLRLTVRTVDGTAVASNRFAALEIRASTNISQTLTQWVRLTNTLVLTSGVVRVDNVQVNQPRRFFIVREPR